MSIWPQSDGAKCMAICIVCATLLSITFLVCVVVDKHLERGYGQAASAEP